MLQRLKAAIRLGLLTLIVIPTSLLAQTTEIVRRIPPKGIELPDEQAAALQKQLAELKERLAQTSHPLRADIDVFAKAVELALAHGEFYNTKEIPRAFSVIKLANDRLNDLSSGKTPWTRERGLVVRGYRSAVDNSVQPYGLVIPAGLDLEKKVPLYVWLHGRGDKITDLHFIHRRLTSAGSIQPENAIVLHPFGRHCMGFKSAGEIDVLDAIDQVKTEYNIDPDRIVLMGFSMGGAGVWHIGAHYTDRFVAMSPGAGFAETARYNRLEPEDYPPPYVQTLWSLYDVPNYVRNLFNIPVVVYSGELDRQIQAARVMEQAYQEEGRSLPHIIGPGMGHKYHPDSLKQILATMARAVDAGLNRKPTKLFLQTRTLRYNRMHWIEAMRLDEHWKDSRIDAEIQDDNSIRVETKNIAELRIDVDRLRMREPNVLIDGDSIALQSGAIFERTDSGWRAVAEPSTRLAKRHGLQGPIDDAFLGPFLVVAPSGQSPNLQVQHWTENELDHFRSRWRALYRGELRIKRDVDVTEEDISKYHLILWGDRHSNQVLGRLLNEHAAQFPIQWDGERISVGEREYSAQSHLLSCIYPNPVNPKKYVVLNSGPTFRESHDRTNSLQNPKLADWAIVDLSVPPNDEAPGRIVVTEFFDEAWRLKP